MSAANGFESVVENGTKTYEQMECEQPQAPPIDMESCIREVEGILMYEFRKKTLLLEALTHPSYAGSPSYQRLEFVGDAALGLALANFAYLTYPNLDPGQLSLIRAANISTEKLARVAVHHGLYRYIRHNAPTLSDKVRDFVIFVENEGQASVYAGKLKAPKVLADIVEAIIAAVYIDVNFDLVALWRVIEVLWEPIVTLETLQAQPQPVTFLYQLCQKQGRKVEIEYSRDGPAIVAIVLIDGQLIASSSSPQKETAKVNVAREALSYLAQSNTNTNVMADVWCELNENNEVEDAKQKLYEICSKMKWPKPIYSVEKEEGPAHGKTYTCSVRIEIAEGILLMTGDGKTRLKEAENSAASLMICRLIESKYISHLPLMQHL
ncbi:hypothetical protein Dimus_029305 [Dionaea muscipula]